MVTGDLAGASIRGQRKPDRESRRNAHCTRISDKDGMEIRAVAASLIASEIDIALSPTGAALVVFHGRHHMVVNRPRLLKIGFCVRCVDYFLCPAADALVDLNQTVWLQPAR